MAIKKPKSNEPSKIWKGVKNMAFWGTAAAIMPHSEPLQFMAGVAAINTVRQAVMGPILPKSWVTDVAARGSFRAAAGLVLAASVAINTATNVEDGQGWDPSLTMGVGETYHNVAKPVADFVHSAGAVSEFFPNLVQDGVEWVSGWDLTADTGKIARTVDLAEYRTFQYLENTFQYADPDI